MELLNEYLFENNPSPMWIFDAETFQFLAVNKAAQKKYKYTEEEFLSNNLFLIRPDTEKQRLLDTFTDIKKREYSDSLYWIHQNKNGDTFHVRVYSFSVMYNNRHARFAQIIDVEDYVEQFNENLKLIDELQLHIDFLKKLSWAHCHQLRGKVSNMLAIHQLYHANAIAPEEIPQMAEISQNELLEVDRLIKQMVHQMKMKCDYEDVLSGAN
jgi:PAS domain S-box-containing protein